LTEIFGMAFSGKHTPRWIIFGIDLAICLFSVLLAYLLRFNFSIPPNEIQSFTYVIPYVLLVRATSFLIWRTYAGIIRYTSTRDAQRIFVAVLVGSSLFVVGNIISYSVSLKNLIPYSIVIIDFITTVFAMSAMRVMIKTLFLELSNTTRDRKNVIIYGAGDFGAIAKRTLDRDAGARYRVVAFVDDDSNKHGKSLEGIKIYGGSEQFLELLKSGEASHLILAISTISSQRKKEIIELCLNHNVKVLDIPPVSRWINGELSFRQIRRTKIEDLLDRDEIQLDEESIRHDFSGRRILVTGAAGSIGSEIAKLLVPFSPSLLILLDNAETPLYELELEIKEKLGFKNYEAVVGDVRNKDRMKRLFDALKPQIVFHAAAYKHVPMMEQNPSEAVNTNVTGTKVMADLAVEYNVEKFVFVSTDKAVNPTNIMGATKRIAEIYIQSLNKITSAKGGTKFVTTRFGNVLESNGSAIPRFRKQIEEGGPVTVTHPEITRYFMTIPEACRLVLEAGAMGKGGEIFIFDMGHSVKIDDLAKRMVQLSGLTLDKDIRIEYTGLRPGEKLYEELLNDQENTMPTHHSKIMIAKVKEYDFNVIEKEISELIILFDRQNNEMLVKKMKQIVPEFISRNSVYEELDKK
jgi:FlaA1/EpsC-like NDP-sugar epimerase